MHQSKIVVGGATRPLTGPRLVVAGHFVRTMRVGGAEHMLYNLLRGFAANMTDTTLLCGRAQDLSPDFRALHAGSETVRVNILGRSRSRFIAEQMACLNGGLIADAILFPNYYVPPIVPRRLGQVGVVMHDFQYRHFPEYFSTRKRTWLRWSQEISMRRADRVVVISDFVRDDAIRWFGERFADKLVTIPNALSWDRFVKGATRPRLCARPYILSVAAHYPHKNLPTLVRAFAEVARVNHDVQLVLCGQSYDNLHGVAGKRTGMGVLIEQLGLADRVQLTGYVDDPTLAQWYAHADLFAFPSVFEGFGMPPIEALGFGLATITTRETALRQMTRGLAEMVEKPFDVSEWATRILEMLAKPEQYRPSAADVADLKAFYHPARIARAYVKALTD